MSRPGMAYISNLTPLRCIAALLVLFFHIDLIMLNGNLALRFHQSALVSKLYLMVDFFFVLSGFIMFHVYGSYFKDKVKGTLFNQFTVARFARVYPLHFFTLLYLVIIWMIVLALHIRVLPVFIESNKWSAVGTNLILIQSLNVHNWYTWNQAAWSISTEWWMYMLFPFLVRPFLRLNTKGRLAVFLLCVAGYCFIMFYVSQIITAPLSLKSPLHNPKNIDATYQYGFFRCMLGFVYGMIAYLLYKDGAGRKFFGKGITLALLSLGMFVSLHLGLWDVLSVSFFPFIVLSAAYGSKRMNLFFGKPYMQRIGDWSFSIYMVHQPLMFTIYFIGAYLHPHAKDYWVLSKSVSASWAICFAFIALTLVTSFLTYRFIEIPARKWINGKFIGKRQKTNLQPAVAPLTAKQ